MRHILPEINLEVMGVCLGVAVASADGVDVWGRGCHVFRTSNGEIGSGSLPPLEVGETLLLVLEAAWPLVHQQPEVIIDWVFHPVKSRALEALSDWLDAPERSGQGTVWLIAGLRRVEF